jgi:hypothetical protein
MLSWISKGEVGRSYAIVIGIRSSIPPCLGANQTGVTAEEEEHEETTATQEIEEFVISDSDEED